MYPLTVALAEFASTFGHSGPHAQVPPKAIDTALTGVIDAIGTMLAAQNEPVVRMVRSAQLGESAPEGHTGRPHAGTLTAQARTYSPGQSSLLLSAARATPSHAAFVNATAAHAFAMDDVAVGCHPSAVLMPALLAEGEAVGANGMQLLNAYIAGFEVLCELSQREPDGLHVTGWHPTAMLGPVAVAAAVANLKHLSPETTQQAIAIAASMTGGIMGNFGTPTKALHAGRTAQAGVMAVRLAQAGVTGAADALEAPTGLLRVLSPKGRVDVENPFERTPETLRILTEGICIKKYPVCYSTHRVVDAAIDLAQHPSFHVEQVERVQIRIGRKQAAMAHHRRPTTPLEAKYSVPFAVAAGLLARDVSFPQLEPAFFLSAPVRRLIDLTELELDDATAADDPVFCPADQIRVKMSNNTVLDSGPVQYARGHARLPLSAEELARKFVDCARHGGRHDATELLTLLRRLPQLDNVAQLTTVSANLISSSST